jgi:hypothetical protein
MKVGNGIKGTAIALIIIQAVAILILGIVYSAYYDNGATFFVFIFSGAFYLCLFGMFFIGFGELISIQGQRLEIEKANAEKSTKKAKSEGKKFKCSNCGAIVTESDEFCTECGYSFSDK